MPALSDNTILHRQVNSVTPSMESPLALSHPSSESLLQAHLLNASPYLKLRPRLYASRSFLSLFQSTRHSLTFY